MKYIIVAAQKLGIEKMHSSDLEDNNLMRKFAAHLQLDHQRDPDDTTQVLYSALPTFDRHRSTLQPGAA